MQLYDIALQGGWDNAGLLADFHLLMGEREAGGLSDIIFFSTLCQCKYIIHADAGRNLWVYRTYQGAQCLKFGVLCLFHCLTEDFTLTFCTVKIRIHQTQSCVSYGLDTVQMVHTTVLQLIRADSGRIYCFCDKGVDVGKFLITDFNVYASQYIDGVNYSLPVEGSIIINVQV